MFQPSVLRLRVPVLLVGVIVLTAALAGGAGMLMGDVHANPSPATVSGTLEEPRTEGPVFTAHKAGKSEKLAELAMHHPPLIRGAYRHIAKLVDKDFDGEDLDLRLPHLILREWSLLDAWVIHQSVERRSDEGYQALLGKLDSSLRVLTLDLGADTTLLAVNASGIGHIVAVQKGLPTPLWRVDWVPMAGAAAEQLGCWRAEAGTRPCAALRAGLLAPDAQGRRRFYIEAEHAQPAGAARVHQLSLWRWDGQAATPFYVTFYGVSSGGQGARIEGDDITIDACAGCSRRQRAQHLQLTAADEVKELQEASEGGPESLPAEL